jgi:hypothetical protein
MAELRLQASDDHVARIAHEGDPLRAVVVDLTLLLPENPPDTTEGA